MIKTTNWRPDTCRCKVSYTWDNTVSAEQRVHVFSEVLNTCAEHPDLQAQVLYDTIHSENVRKNRAIEIVESLSPPPPEDSRGRLHPSERTYWDFNPLRVLLITAPTRVDSAMRLIAQGRMDTEFGLGKARLV